MKIIDAKLLKFLFVGVLNTIFGAGIMFLLYNVFGCSYWVSSVCNYVFGGILSFFLNKFFTFQNKQKSLRQIILFALTILFCYLIAYIGAKNLVYQILASQSLKIRDNAAMFIGMCIYTALNYLAQRFIVFK
ncbi:GtrA family protein [uncultured Treponema sp.]|uniref:GtrA family protein n=1 Tax=uncultured Treponema sp. TaxID=162155 RepID=UPI0026087542|nr:GtrA family protein [uncultured Treponema sp.]